MTAFGIAVNAALLHFLWQGTVVALLLRLVLSALANRSANARYLAAAVALGVLTVLPVGTVVSLLLHPQAPLVNGALLLSATHRMSAFAAARDLSIAQFERWTLPLWGVGAAVCSLRFLRGYSTVEALRDSGTTAEDALVACVQRLAHRIGLSNTVGVLISSTIDGPSVVGWLRPVILIPAATLLGLTQEQLELILAHELAHIRRHDYLINMLQMGVETILFYHPAVWWVSARMREERELCCDDVVVRTMGHRLTYARALTALERLRLNAPTLALASTDGSLSYRVQRLLEGSPSSPHAMKLPTLLTVCLALACAAPVIDSPKNKPATTAATTEQAVNNEPGAGGWKNEQDRIQAGHPNPNEAGPSEASLHLVAVSNVAADVTGRVLASIQYTNNVSASVRDQVHLPVALGNTLDADSPSRIEKALAAVDSNLNMTLRPSDNGHAALIISRFTGSVERGWTSGDPDHPRTEPGDQGKPTSGGLRLRPGTARDSSPRTSNGPRRIDPDHPLFDFQVEQQVTPAPGNSAPAYPAELRMHNVEGTTLVQFVVDTTGHADMSTFTQVSTSDPLFTQAVKDHLPEMRFIPAEVGSRKVKQLIRMPFTFTLR